MEIFKGEQDQRNYYTFNPSDYNTKEALTKVARRKKCAIGDLAIKRGIIIREDEEGIDRLYIDTEWKESDGERVWVVYAR